MYRSAYSTVQVIYAPSPCELFGEPSAVPSCEEKGSSEASGEPSDENYFHVKVHVKPQMNLLLT